MTSQLLEKIETLGRFPILIFLKSAPIDLTSWLPMPIRLFHWFCVT